MKIIALQYAIGAENQRLILHRPIGTTGIGFYSEACQDMGVAAYRQIMEEGVRGTGGVFGGAVGVEAKAGVEHFGQDDQVVGAYGDRGEQGGDFVMVGRFVFPDDVVLEGDDFHGLYYNRAALTGKGKCARMAGMEKENTILAGDCVELLGELLAENGGESFADLIFADPPFNIGYGYDKYDDQVDHDKYVAWTQTWMGACRDALLPHGSFWVAIGDDYAAEVRVAARQLGLVMRNWIIWYYTFGQQTKKKFARSHTHIFYFVKDEKNFIFNDAVIRVPSARQLVYNDKRADARGRVPDDTWILRPQEIEDEGAFGADEDTWHISRVCGTFKERTGFHGCQMPEKLLERIILTASNEGQLILDPFSGSGTTVAVAARLGRRYLGIDLSENYVEQGLRRLDDAKTLF